MRPLRAVPALLATAIALPAAERINHAGRELGALPTVSTPLLFNTTAADAVVSAMQILPRENPWNEDISGLPVHADSAAIMAQIGTDLAAKGAGRQRLRVFGEMNYTLVPDGQPLLDMTFVDYPDDSDFNGGTNPVAKWPAHADLPVETWPGWTGAGDLPPADLHVWQRDTGGGDRHSIVVQPNASRLFETWQTLLTTNAIPWQASNGAIFNLTTGALRTPGWTSGDAAGLPMFPALIRYDECQRGEIEHALRIVVAKSRKAYIYPATHYASSLTGASYPAMGQRVRLKSSFSIPAGWSRESKAVAAALKRYGALVADNGGFFSVSACPDDRFVDGCFSDVETIALTNFEIIQTTGPGEGPRSSGAPTANAGPDQTVALSAGAHLAGATTGTGLTRTWTLYDSNVPGGTATFSAPNADTGEVSLSAPGRYRLRLKAADGTHTPAYDIVVITVTADGGTPPVITPPPATPTTPTSQNDDGGDGGACGASSGLAALFSLTALLIRRLI